MKNRLRTVFRVLFTLAILVFLLLAFVLVFSQVVGLVIAQPALITGASDLLLQPSIIAAICVGLLGFAYYNTTEGRKDS
jgi:sugar phosphate permease